MYTLFQKGKMKFIGNLLLPFRITKYSWHLLNLTIENGLIHFNIISSVNIDFHVTEIK